MPDVQIYSGKDVATPSVYVLPGSAEFTLKAVSAILYDNGATSDWLPCVTIVSDSGHVIARAVDQAAKVTAGDEAEVSWFPGVKNSAAATPSGTGAPDYVMMTGVATAIPSVGGGATGQMPWDNATKVSNDLTNWSFTLDGFGNIVQVLSNKPGRFEGLAAFAFDAPSAAVTETASMSVVAGAVTLLTNTVAIKTANKYEGFVGAFGERSASSIVFETDWSFDNAATGQIRGQWWWIKRWAL